MKPGSNFSLNTTRNTHFFGEKLFVGIPADFSAKISNEKLFLVEVILKAKSAGISVESFHVNKLQQIPQETIFNESQILRKRMVIFCGICCVFGCRFVCKFYLFFIY